MDKKPSFGITGFRTTHRNRNIGGVWGYDATYDKHETPAFYTNRSFHIWIGPFGIHIFYDNVIVRKNDVSFRVTPDFHWPGTDY
jgi:hypothetical protein